MRSITELSSSNCAMVGSGVDVTKCECMAGYNTTVDGNSCLGIKLINMCI